MANNDAWRLQQPARRRGSAVVIVLVMLAILVIIGGVGLVLLPVYLHSNNVSSQVTPVSKSALRPDQSPQTVYKSITSSPPVLIDPLTHNTMMQWFGNLPSYSAGGATLSADHLELISQCAAAYTDLNNFAVQVKMTIVHGDEGGLIFRYDSNTAHSGIFSLDTGGAFSMMITSNPFNTLLHHPDAAIKAGLGQSNILTVIVEGQTVLLYVNDHYLGQVTNANIPRNGGIGLMAYDVADPTDVLFSNLRVWKL